MFACNVNIAMLSWLLLEWFSQDDETAYNDVDIKFVLSAFVACKRSSWIMENLLPGNLCYKLLCCISFLLNLKSYCNLKVSSIAMIVDTNALAASPCDCPSLDRKQHKGLLQLEGLLEKQWEGWEWPRGLKVVPNYI